MSDPVRNFVAMLSCDEADMIHIFKVRTMQILRPCRFTCDIHVDMHF